MHYRSNLILLVGGGPSPARPLQQLLVWDDSKQQITSEIIFEAEIKAVKQGKDKFTAQ
jgi:hypothetical protein